MGFRCGIVGLPNVGKSTLFRALTSSETTAAENYPFCTIEPEDGMVDVPDARLTRIADIVNPKKIIATTVQFVDIAGLVKGAWKGEGLGNQFLANIRETQAILHVVRCFDDEDIIHVEGRVDPVSDVEIIDMELCLADQETIQKALQRFSKVAKTGDKDAKATLEWLEELQAHLNQGLPARSWGQIHEDPVQKVLKTLCLLTAKPVMLLANVDDSGVDNEHVNALRAYADQQGSTVLPISMKIESELIALEEEERQEMLADLGWEEPGLHRVIRAGYQLLNLETYFTAGEKEVRAWTVQGNTLAPDAAGVIHSDFAKTFIRAEVISYDDFITYQGEQGAKDAGKWRLEGKEYIVKDGDVIHFRTGA